MSRKSVTTFDFKSGVMFPLILPGLNPTGGNFSCIMSYCLVNLWCLNNVVGALVLCGNAYYMSECSHVCMSIKLPASVG
jgi:hypothetical protein